MTCSVLLTGATGFVGRQVLRDLTQRHCKIYVLSRSAAQRFPDGVNVVLVSSIEQYTGEKLPDTLDCIIHLVAKAHVTENEVERDEYTRVNVDGTRALLTIARAKRVKHFIYMSSIKASGEFPAQGKLTETDTCHPQGVYGETKWQAEQLLNELVSDNTKVSVVRPPLVYGAGVKANMAALIKLVKWLPVLPFGGIDNRRSVISVRNLSDFVMTLVFTKPLIEYRHEVFIVADKASLSTSQLCRFIADGLVKKVQIVNIPESLLAMLVKLIGMTKPWQKLTGNAEVQGIHPYKYFNWQAQRGSADEIIAMVRGKK